MQLGKMRLKILKHAEIRMIEDVEEDILQLITRMRVDERLYRNAVRQQKHDAHHREIEQFSELQHIPQSYPSSVHV